MEDTTQDLAPVGYAVGFLTGSLAGSSFALTKAIITIGRDASNDIVIADDPSIAAYHARLLLRQGAWSIERHPGAGSVTINQKPAGGAPVAIPGGATILLGEATMLLFSHGASPEDTVASISEQELEEASSATSLLAHDETSPSPPPPAVPPTIPSLPKSLLKDRKSVV